jgi:hypothetical protein
VLGKGSLPNLQRGFFLIEQQFPWSGDEMMFDSPEGLTIHMAWAIGESRVFAIITVNSPGCQHIVLIFGIPDNPEFGFLGGRRGVGRMLEIKRVQGHD